MNADVTGQMDYHTLHSTLGAESAHCGPDTPKIYSVEMEDDYTYHKMKMHDNTIHHMV